MQEDALESILEMNLERIQHARGKGKKQVAVFEYATSAFGLQLLVYEASS